MSAVHPLQPLAGGVMIGAAMLAGMALHHLVFDRGDRLLPPRRSPLQPQG